MNMLTHPDFGEIRTEKHNDEFVFCAADLCQVLQLSNVTESLRNLDDDEKLTSVIVRSGQKREMNFVTESGLYALIIRSRKPETHTPQMCVLPGIKSCTSYSIPSKVLNICCNNCNLTD